MTIRNLLPLALIALPLAVQARPAYPGIIRDVTPDGKVMEIRRFGDEHFNYVTDADGQYLLEKNSKGTWEKITSYGPALTTSQADIRKYKLNTTPVMAEPETMAALTDEGRTTFPTHVQGAPALVILCEFSDTKFSVENPKETFSRMLNEKGFSDFGACGSARDYYLACSNGQFDVNFVVTDVVPLSHTSAWYNGNDVDITQGYTPVGRRHLRMGDLVRECLLYLDEKGFDFSPYDQDNNGEIDNIFFYYAGFGQADTPDNTTIWPHQGSYRNYEINEGGYYPGSYEPIIVDGLKMRTYACSNELKGIYYGTDTVCLDGIGAFCHEYGHVLGLPDMYDVMRNGTKTPLSYTIMDTGSYNKESTCPPLFSAYEQWLCNWLEVPLVDEGTVMTIPSLSDTSDRKAYRWRGRRDAPGGAIKYTDEYFFVETRHNTGWDASLKEEGMFIWRVDWSSVLWQTNNVNTDPTRPRIELINSGKNYFAWPGENNMVYTNPTEDFPVTTNNRSKLYKINLSGISYDAENHVGTMGYNVYSDLLTPGPVLKENIELNAENRTFFLEWEPTENASYYLVTVKRKNSQGTEYFVDGFNKKNVGNVTRVEVGNISATAWKQYYTAYVVAVTDFPSVSSNVLEFCPATYVGVDDIVADGEVILGGKGCIEAPADAEVFTVGGMKTGRENLPAGIYIVRTSRSVAKVVVK